MSGPEATLHLELPLSPTQGHPLKPLKNPENTEEILRDDQQ